MLAHVSACLNGRGFESGNTTPPANGSTLLDCREWMSETYLVFLVHYPDRKTERGIPVAEFAIETCNYPVAGGRISFL